jgi:hypothetical protein
MTTMTTAAVAATAVAATAVAATTVAATTVAATAVAATALRIGCGGACAHHQTRHAKRDDRAGPEHGACC